VQPEPSRQHEQKAQNIRIYRIGDMEIECDLYNIARKVTNIQTGMVNQESIYLGHQIIESGKDEQEKPLYTTVTPSSELLSAANKDWTDLMAKLGEGAENEAEETYSTSSSGELELHGSNTTRLAHLSGFKYTGKLDVPAAWSKKSVTAYLEQYRSLTNDYQNSVLKDLGITVLSFDKCPKKMFNVCECSTKVIENWWVISENGFLTKFIYCAACQGIFYISAPEFTKLQLALRKRAKIHG